jgi:hypothetical protein
VHLLDVDARVSGLYVEFQRRRSVEQMLVALRTVLSPMSEIGARDEES